eukprot:GEMP01038928.1.p1 GENE.GEMP01038928.1~~GEMP01038928.1.p1  ORF type:complete len:140 (+),score=12.36 GEMP01038928.1:199-618(+)
MCRESEVRVSVGDEAADKFPNSRPKSSISAPPCLDDMPDFMLPVVEEPGPRCSAFSCFPMSLHSTCDMHLHTCLLPNPQISAACGGLNPVFWIKDEAEISEDELPELHICRLSFLDDTFGASPWLRKTLRDICEAFVSA